MVHASYYFSSLFFFFFFFFFNNPLTLHKKGQVISIIFTQRILLCSVIEQFLLVIIIDYKGVTNMRAFPSTWARLQNTRAQLFKATLA